MGCRVKRNCHQDTGRQMAHLYLKIHEAHRVVPLWFRAVHRVIDTGGACGGAGRAGTWGCPCRERPRAGHCGPLAGEF
jgi:hypothetical protein